LQGLGAYRPRRREQESLAEFHVEIEQIDHRALAFDLLGDEADAETAEQVGEVARVDIGGSAPVEDEACRQLEETKAAARQLARLKPQVRDIVHREAITKLVEGREALALDRTGAAQAAL